LNGALTVLSPARRGEERVLEPRVFVGRF